MDNVEDGSRARREQERVAAAGILRLAASTNCAKIKAHAADTEAGTEPTQRRPRSAPTAARATMLV